jgi:hypothetical protein
VAALVAVLAIATGLRLYALDRVVDSFDGELTGYYAAATRLAGIPLANEGVDGSWAPLGLTFYPPYVVAAHAVGTTVLALRLAAAWVGVLSIPLLYTFVRRLAGAPAALIAAALLALDPLSLGWSRSDAHPHGFTLWPVLLVCLATLAALRGGGRRAWFATALAMGLAWHQYPSGQVAVLIPPLAVVLLAGAPGERRQRLRGALPFLLLGVVLWFGGLPLSGWLATGRIELRNPFTLTGSRAAWSRDVDTTARNGPRGGSEAQLSATPPTSRSECSARRGWSATRSSCPIQTRCRRAHCRGRSQYSDCSAPWCWRAGGRTRGRPSCWRGWPSRRCRRSWPPRRIPSARPRCTRH